MNKIIAIDGPAASGKGTLSRNLAAHLNFAHMDTGALYRAIGLKMQESNSTPEEAAIALAHHFNPDQLKNPALRTNEIGQIASKIASIPTIRQTLLSLQKNFAQNPPAPFHGAILDGRDIGTIICPEAPAKLFVTARIDARAKRRTKELLLRGQNVIYEAVLKDMRERDARDSSRNAAPMIPAENALIIDTSDLTETQVFEKALEFIKSKL
jgi:cytidylate kinase